MLANRLYLTTNDNELCLCVGCFDVVDDGDDRDDDGDDDDGFEFF